MSKNKNIKKKSFVIGADHAGYKLKEEVKKFLLKKGRNVLDIGTKNTESVDYPDYALLMSKKIGNDKKKFGVLICGSGIGMNMAANRYKNIRAALCYNIKTSKLSRMHNNANVISIGPRLTKKNIALKCITVFEKTKFSGGRHLRRVKKI